MRTRMTRRQWTALIACAPAFAQPPSTVPPQGVPSAAQPPATPEQRLQKATAEVHQASDRLAQIDLPMNIEPAFTFHA